MTWPKIIALAVLLLPSSSHFLFAETRTRPIQNRAAMLLSQRFERGNTQVEELFAEALREIWIEAGTGVVEYEAGFALNRIGDEYVIAFAPMSYERNMELRIPINTSGITVAIAHTHPNSGQDVPSGAQHLSPGHGDVFSPVPNYVVSRSGIWVTNPADHSYRRVSGPSWAHGLRALAFAGVLNPDLAKTTSTISTDNDQSTNWQGDANHQDAWKPESAATQP